MLLGGYQEAVLALFWRLRSTLFSSWSSPRLRSITRKLKNKIRVGSSLPPPPPYSTPFFPGQIIRARKIFNSQEDNFWAPSQNRRLLDKIILVHSSQYWVISWAALEHLMRWNHRNHLTHLTHMTRTDKARLVPTVSHLTHLTLCSHIML